MRRFIAAALVLGIAATLGAEQGWVTNRGGTTVNVFNPSTNAEIGTITVGTAPVDIVSNRPESENPQRFFVANSGSNDISVIDAPDRFQVLLITGDSGFGTFLNPTGLTRTWNNYIAVVDEKVVGASKSTLRFIDPDALSVIDGFTDGGGTARYVDVVVTSNQRIWITDDGDNGVVCVRLDGQSGPPFSGAINRQLFGTAQDYADFLFDNAGTPTFLLNPQRLATNGTDRVVVADGGSDILTILNANYSVGAELTQGIQANVDLGLAPGAVAIDVEVVGTKVYVTTNDPAQEVVVVSLSTESVLTSIDLPTTVGGMGRTVDGSKLYVGGGAGIDDIYEISTTTDTLTTTITGFTGGAFPFGFSFTGDPLPSSSPSNGGGGSPGCGMLGLEALLVLGLLRCVRRRR